MITTYNYGSYVTAANPVDHKILPPQCNGDLARRRQHVERTTRLQRVRAANLQYDMRILSRRGASAGVLSSVLCKQALRGVPYTLTERDWEIVKRALIESSDTVRNAEQASAIYHAVHKMRVPRSVEPEYVKTLQGLKAICRLFQE